MFRYEKPQGDRKQRKAVKFLRAGMHPHGKIEIRGINSGQFVTVSGAGLPAVAIQHPEGFSSDPG